MSESAHIRNLLSQNKGEESYLKDDNNSYSSLPRFGLRGAAAQVVDNLYGLIFEIFDGHANDNMLIKFSMYADSDESVFYSSAGNLENCMPMLQGDFFESFPDLFITIYVSNDHIYGNPPPSPDAIFAHDPDSEYDMGEIDLKVCLPPTLKGSLDYLRTHRLEICGVLAHEMQHVVQKHCYGEALGNTTAQDVLLHALDKNEIDARVEEIIACMEEGYQEEDKDHFYDRLVWYTDRYLSRNLDEDGSYPDDLREVMIKRHLDIYLQKMEGIL